MNKAPTKQYFADVIADQNCSLCFVRLMPNNITTCKLIEQTLEDNGYKYIITIPGYQEQQRAKHITARNDRTRRMYLTVWSDHTYDYNYIDELILADSYCDDTFPCSYLTGRNAKEATLQALEALKELEDDTCKS